MANGYGDSRRGEMGTGSQEALARDQRYFEKGNGSQARIYRQGVSPLEEFTGTAGRSKKDQERLERLREKRRQAMSEKTVQDNCRAATN